MYYQLGNNYNYNANIAPCCKLYGFLNLHQCIRMQAKCFYTGHGASSNLSYSLCLFCVFQHELHYLSQVSTSNKESEFIYLVFLSRVIGHGVFDLYICVGIDSVNERFES